MSDRTKKLFGIGCIGILISLIFMMLTKMVDVQAIGPEGSSVGSARLNGAVRDLIGHHSFWETLTDLLGYLAILICCFFGLIGLLQLIRERSLTRVDPRILLLGIFYIAVILIYVIFEIFPVNYRPILEDGKLEASFPSSHTMLTLCVMLSAVPVLKRIMKIETVTATASLALPVLAGLAVIGRLLSGVHWLTDIVGGILISAALLCFFYGGLEIADRLVRRHRKGRKHEQRK